MDLQMRATFPKERRTASSRRRLLRPTEWRWLFGGRRRTVRRTGEGRIRRLDTYSTPLFTATMVILLLSTLDAAFTLNLLHLGVVTEANPLMAGVLSTDVHQFSKLKTALTCSGLIVLVLYSEVRILGRIKTAYSVYAIAGFYTLLIGYELTLLAIS